MLKLDINKPIRVYASRGMISIESSVTIKEAARMMIETGTPILVVTEKQKPVGSITKQDILLKTVIGDTDPDMPVGKIIASPIVKISENATVKEALTTMTEKGIDHLVVESKGEPIGVFSRSNLLEIGKVKI
ncbi:MAG: cyclic nucleotide-binding/CBS domain-containing protein [Promethearchaeota archaeon]